MITVKSVFDSLVERTPNYFCWEDSEPGELRVAVNNSLWVPYVNRLITDGYATVVELDVDGCVILRYTGKEWSDG